MPSEWSAVRFEIGACALRRCPNTTFWVVQGASTYCREAAWEPEGAAGGVSSLESWSSAEPRGSVATEDVASKHLATAITQAKCYCTRARSPTHPDPPCGVRTKDILCCTASMANCTTAVSTSGSVRNLSLRHARCAAERPAFHRRCVHSVVASRSSRRLQQVTPPLALRRACSSCAEFVQGIRQPDLDIS